VNVGRFLGRLRDAGGVVTLGSDGEVRSLGNASVMTPEVRGAIARNADAFRRFIERERAATLASTTTRSLGWCERCGRVIWVGTGAERLASGELACGDCASPADIEAGSVTIVEPGNDGQASRLV
jgi:hypothetical protein